MTGAPLPSGSPVRGADIQTSAPAREREAETLLGKGRSGSVWLCPSPAGLRACKRFGSHGLTKAVQILFLGAPNPYQWNEDAVRSAVLRRRILARLVPVWSGGRLRVASAYGHAWNPEERAFELHTEFVRGRPPRLRHPLRAPALEAAGLWRTLLKPLQAQLAAAGFHGLVWQAGRGNPVALNNFLLEESTGAWVWIDLESGVPALAPMNPLALFRYYLPRCAAFGRPLFDDVDVAALRSHIQARQALYESRLGTAALQELREDVDGLETVQRAWKSVSRREGAIRYRLARGRLTPAEAERYRTHPLAWYTREALRCGCGLGSRVLRAAGETGRRLVSFPWKAASLAVLRFLGSQAHRESLARGYVARRLAAWRRRRQISRSDAAFLREQARRRDATSYLADFGVHLAIKPFVKAAEYWLAPMLFALGWIDGQVLAIVMVSGGSVGRTAYTGWRTLQATLQRRERPWVALLVGAVPVLGNCAYPLQILYSSTEEQGQLARFLLYDCLARLGRHLPVWGGPDTLTEHFFNRLPDHIPVAGGRAPSSAAAS